jgi:hypothetical protein
MQVLLMTVSVDRTLTQAEMRDVQSECSVQLVHLNALNATKHAYSVEFFEGSTTADVLDFIDVMKRF